MEKECGTVRRGALRERSVTELSAVYLVISLLGWIFEKVGRYLLYNSLSDRGFLSMPLCPIYATGVMSVYILFGTPTRLRILGRRVKCPRGVSVLIYFLLSAFAASAAEFVVALFFDKAFGIRLWDYSGRVMNIFGYVCLPYSLLWGALITLFMMSVWRGLLYLVRKADVKKLSIATTVIYIAIAFDMAFNVLYLLKNGSHFKFL